MNDVIVVGPIYQEISQGSTRLGSAARGATILSSLSHRVTLYAFGTEQDKKRVDGIEEQGVVVHWVRLGEGNAPFPQTMFRYPMVWGDPQISPLTQQPLEFLDQIPGAKAALVFGSRGGRPPINVETVVYDPQDGSDAKLFTNNDSTAKRQYYALNLREARALINAEIDNPADALKQLVHDRYLSGAVIRLGPLGYLHYDGYDLGWVPASSRRVQYKVGAGGAFAAFLLHEIVANESSLAKAVSYAASGVGKFQETGADVFGPSTALEIRDSIEPSRVEIPPLSLRDVTIQLIAPNLTTSEQWLREQMRGAWTSLGARVVDAVNLPLDNPRPTLTVVAIGGREYASALALVGQARERLIVLLECPLDPREAAFVAQRSAYVTHSPLDAIVRASKMAQNA